MSLRLFPGTLPINEAQGVHSLTDVPVFANGPGSEMFRGVYNSIDIFFKIADALALGKYSNESDHEKVYQRGLEADVFALDVEA